MTLSVLICNSMIGYLTIIWAMYALEADKPSRIFLITNLVWFGFYTFYTSNLFLAHYMMSLNDKDVFKGHTWCVVIAISFIFPLIFIPPLGLIAFWFFVEVESKLHSKTRFIIELIILFICITAWALTDWNLAYSTLKLEIEASRYILIIIYALVWIYLGLFTLLRDKRKYMNLFHPMGWIAMVSYSLS